MENKFQRLEHDRGQEFAAVAETPREVTAGTAVGASSGRVYIESRGMVTRTPRRGWLWRSSKGKMCAHCVTRRMVEAWPCAPVTSQGKAVKGISRAV